MRPDISKTKQLNTKVNLNQERNNQANKLE